MGEAGRDIATLRWGVLGTGWMSSMFVADLLTERGTAPAHHVVVAVGSSSIEKGNAFVDKAWKDSFKPRPRVYDQYQKVYNDPDVDIVYVGTPHSLHKRNCLDAIAQGKHVLCEKPFTINEREAQEVIDAAKAKGVFIMEAVWTRFFPLFRDLHEHLYVKKSIGNILRLFVDFGIKMPLENLPSNSRLKDPALGAGALLDVGIYSLTLASLIMGEGKVGNAHPDPAVISSLSIVNGIDESNVVVLEYGGREHISRTAICTSSLRCASSQDFARIEGSEGTIVIFGLGASCPSGFRVRQAAVDKENEAEEQTFRFDHPSKTFGWVHEADAVAQDISEGRTENSIMPLDETLRVLRLMDGIRRSNGLVYPQDS